MESRECFERAGRGARGSGGTIDGDAAEGSEDVRLLSPTRIIEGPGDLPGLDGIGKRGKQDASCL
jgi:hypothetical protein